MQRQQQGESPEEWEQRQRGRRVTANDRASLLRLMTDSLHQQAKLGAAFSLAAQRRSQAFWRAAARYLALPLAAAMLEGLRLRPGGGRERGCSDGG